MDDFAVRSQDISNFLGVPLSETIIRLNNGFHYNHAKVAEDFKAANPQTDEELLQWYMTTDAYIWELSAYHLDTGFNYEGMTQGIVEKISNSGALNALVLGDGIGDTSMELRKAGITAFYHDLWGSQTMEFAGMRHRREFGNFQHYLTSNWDAYFGMDLWGAVVALDFMEHLPEPQVEKWAKAVAESLIKGGLFAAQNAFAIGDSEHGDSIPMHISASNHYEHDWAPLMNSLGLHQVGDIWWMKQ